MPFLKLCTLSDLPPGSAFRAETPAGAIALFNVDGEIYAIEDTCSHGQWSLSDGYLDGHLVECSLHMAKFCVRTGRACTLPATAPVKVFPVRVEGSDVCVDPAAGRVDA